MAQTIEPAVDADVARSFRTGVAKTQASREKVKARLEDVVARLEEVRTPLAAFASGPIAVRTALQLDGGMILADLENTRGYVLMLKNAIGQLLEPALSAATDPISAVSVQATLRGFVAGLEQSLANTKEVAAQAVTSAGGVVEALMQDDKATAATLHADAARAIAPGIAEIDGAVASLAVLKKSLL
ncbi:MAG: hypothetical protein IT381_13630 [Deltaproteobacteria bacterium]|nr:hypothetical protein [Deltaproteobacteria bacterium]